MGIAERSADLNQIPVVISQTEHGISRADISEYALRVLYRLKDAGYQAYLVGGGVRDLLLGREPKDFDVVTNAHPEDVHGLFRNSRLIGRRFRLAHVQFGREIVEVATFRALLDPVSTTQEDAVVKDGRIIRDNVYGTIEQDATRRDFTVNSLYYDIQDHSVVDYTSAMEDLKTGTLRIIGDPETRLREDPVRMLRAVRFAAKLGFRIDPLTETIISKLAHIIGDVPAPRLFDEVLKLFHSGCALETFELLRHYGLFGRLFPDTEKALAREDQGFPVTFVSRALQNTDDRINSGKPVTPAFLYAVLLWEPVRQRMQRFLRSGMTESQALQLAGRDVISEQLRSTSLPKRYSTPMREIWQLQPRFKHRTGKRPRRLMMHPKFRAAYDFFCLRATVDNTLKEQCAWWTRIQEVDEVGVQKMTQVTTRRSRYRQRAVKKE